MSQELFNYHTHALEHGFDKKPEVSQTISKAMEFGLSSICLTDHFPLPFGFLDPTPEKDCAMSLEDYPRYIKELKRVKKERRDEIEVLLGVEFDWLPDYQDWIKSQLARYAFDCVIGSVHFLGKLEDGRNFLLDFCEEEFLKGAACFGGIEALIKAYFREVRAMVKSGLFDVVGHIDLVKKYNDGDMFSQNSDWYQKCVLETLDVVSETDMVLEINTAGLTKKCQAQYPSLWILQQARKRGIGLTIGTDSHTPETVGRNLKRGIEVAKEAGFDSLLKFKKRKKIEVKL